MLPRQILDAHAISDNKDVLIMEMKLPDLVPGKFELEIEAIEKNTSSSFSVRRFFKMK